MAQAKKDKRKKGQYHILVLACSNCGEEQHMIKVCPHCNSHLTYKESLDLSKEELEELIEDLQNDSSDLIGDVEQVLEEDEGEEKPANSAPPANSEMDIETGDDDDIIPLDEKEVGDMTLDDL